MSTWILTMILIAHSSGRVATSIATHDYSSKEKCEIAKSNFISLGMNGNSDKYVAYCTEK